MKRSFRSKLLLLMFGFMPFSGIKAQNCTGCTTTITGANSATHIISSGQKLCITSTGSVTGTVILNGGAVCNEGNFQPSSFSFSSGTLNNYGTLTQSGMTLGGSQTVVNHTGATFTVSGTLIIGSANVNFTNQATLSLGGLTKSSGTFTNTGTVSTPNNISNSGGTFNNNGGAITAGGNFNVTGGTVANATTINCVDFSISGGSFTNNAGATVAASDDFTNNITGTVNSGTITVTDLFSNTGGFTNNAAGTITVNNDLNSSGTFTNNGNINVTDDFTVPGGTFNIGNGSQVQCNDFTNNGTVNGPGAGAGCGVIKIAVQSTNSGSITGYADICDATPPAGSIKIDVNTGNVAGTVTYCVCCVLTTATITGDDDICQGQSTTLTANPAGTSYSWSSGQTTQAITVNPASTTTYTVTITFANNCTRSASKTVTVNPNPAANTGGDKSITAGSSVIIGGGPTGMNGTPPLTFLWTPAAGLSSTTVANPSASPNMTTTYTVTVTDAKGCTATDQVEVIVQFVYGSLKKKLDGGFYYSLNGKVYFRYSEEYNDSDNKLKYNVYDKHRNVVLSDNGGQLLPVKLGDNQYSLDVGTLTEGFYVVEAVNEKGEKFMLRFQVL